MVKQRVSVVLIALAVSVMGMSMSSVAEVSANRGQGLTSVALEAELYRATTPQIQGPANDFRTFLPVVQGFGPNTVDQALTALVDDLLAQSGSGLTLRGLHYRPPVLSIDFGSTAPVQIDSYEFRDLLSDLTVVISNYLAAQEPGAVPDFDFEFFVNGELLAPATMPQDSVSQGDQDANHGTQTPRVVLSPGHGWHQTPAGGWSLERGYHWGVVEDFVNAELVMTLHDLLAGSGLDRRPAREVSPGAGTHPASGHPWWQMGASEYVRSLGAPGTVWGENFVGPDRNIVAPPEYANWIGADVLINLHNNGFDGAAHGTLVLYDTSNGYQEQSRRLAELVHARLIERLRAEWDPSWTSYGVRGSNGAYGENRRFRGPAILVELAFMDNPIDNAALQNPQFRSIAMSAVRDALVEFLAGAPPPDPGGPTTFLGRPSSRLFFDQAGERINLEICADNLPGQTVSVRLSRPGQAWDVVSLPADARCVTFWDLDGPGPVMQDVAYTTRAALNARPNDAWSVPCYNATGGRGLCDSAVYQTAPVVPTVFAGNPSSRLFFDQNGQRINLEICADNLLNQTVYARLSRSGMAWDVASQRSAGRCVTFWDMDGAGPTLTDTTYTSRAALNQPPVDSWPVPCFNSTGGQGLCDDTSRLGSAPIVFSGGVSSRLFFDQNGERINLEICANNLPGQTVYARLSRPGNVWSAVTQQATDRCVTFWDMDGAGATFTNTTYTTRAALNQPPNDNWPVPCFNATGGQGLCDSASR